MTRYDGSAEQEFWSGLLIKIMDDGCRKIVCYHSKWYSHKARHCKFWHYAFTVITALLAGSVVIISVIEGFNEGVSKYNVVITCISVVTSFIAIMQNLVRPQENWVRMRTCLESMKFEAESFLTECDEYKNRDQKEREQILAKRLADLSKNETRKWVSTSEKKVDLDQIRNTMAD